MEKLSNPAAVEEAFQFWTLKFGGHVRWNTSEIDAGVYTDNPTMQKKVQFEVIYAGCQRLMNHAWTVNYGTWLLLSTDEKYPKWNISNCIWQWKLDRWLILRACGSLV